MILGLRIHSLFSKKSKTGLKGRATTPNFPPKSGKRIIVHCASLGEYEQAKAIIQKCRASDIEVILTFFSPSGFEALKDKEAATAVAYLPFDTPKKVDAFLEAAQADLIVIIKYEFWWNLIRAELPIVFASVVLSEEHYLFKGWAKPFLETLRNVNSIFVVDGPSYDLLSKHEFKNHFLVGDTRVESILQRKSEGHIDPIIKKFCGDKKVLIYASTYPIEHEEIIQNISALNEQEKILIFPHEINQKEIYTLKEHFGKDCVVYSEWKDKPIFLGHKIMIVNAIGLLKDAYRFAKIAYVGGGFTHGIHNILEPFVYKLPVIFGPRHEKFPEARLLAKQEFVKVIHNIEDLGGAIQILWKDVWDTKIDEIYSTIFEAGHTPSSQIVAQIKNELWKQSA